MSGLGLRVSITRSRLHKQLISHVEEGLAHPSLIVRHCGTMLLPAPRSGDRGPSFPQKSLPDRLPRFPRSAMQAPGHPPLRDKPAAPVNAPQLRQPHGGAGRHVTHPSLRCGSSDIPARTPTCRRPRPETDTERAQHGHLVAAGSGACDSAAWPSGGRSPPGPERRDRSGRPPASGPPGSRGQGHSLPPRSPPPQNLTQVSARAPVPGLGAPQAGGSLAPPGLLRRAPRAVGSVAGCWWGSRGLRGGAAGV